VTSPDPLDATKGDSPNQGKANIAPKLPKMQAQKKLEKDVKNILTSPKGYYMKQTRPRTSADNKGD
jgi:hypothetical protein